MSPIYEGVYKATLVDVAKDGGSRLCESVYAQFKISEVLAGRESHSNFPSLKIIMLSPLIRLIIRKVDWLNFLTAYSLESGCFSIET